MDNIIIYQVDDISKLVNMNILSKDELLLYNKAEKFLNNVNFIKRLSYIS